MATKVKPTRLQITWTPQAWQVPIYVNPDCFCWGSSGCQWTVIWPSSSCDWDIPLFCGTCWDCIIDSWEKLCDYAKCCDIPTDNCQLANWCWYQTTSCMVNDFSSPNSTTYPTTEAVCCYVWQKIAGAYIYKWTVNTYEDLPTTWLTAWDVYNVTTAHTTSPEFPAWANLAWTWSDWDVLWWLVDLSWKQDVLTAWPNITIASNVISWDFNYATSSTAAACTTKCVCIPEITQLCTWQQITVMPSVTATNCATNLKLNDFTAYPIRYMNAALTSATDWYVWWANCLATFVFDWSYWHVVSKSYDTNTTYTLNTLLDAWKKTAWTGTYALSRYSLVMEKWDWTWEKITNTAAAYSTATTKTVNTSWFRLNKIRYYNTTTNVANGALIATNTLANQAASVDLRYSTNCWGTTTWAEWDYIYLVGKMWVDWLFYLDTTQRWTNTLPTTNDWKLYIRLWLVLTAASYTMSLLIDRPIFYYDNWIKEYKVADNKQDTLVSWTNIKTVNGCDLLWSWDLCIAWWVSSVNGQTWAVCLSIPTDNCELANWCWYQYVCNMVCDLTWADNTHYPTAKAVADAIQGAWGWDMMKSTYDPCNCNDDAFDYCNFHNTPTIPDVSNLAQCCDIPTNNNQLANGCWYTTCTWTLSTCSDITTALWFTPYSATNPCWYTTCTWTLQACDIANLAQCCDIPTNNNQLANWCWYITWINCLDVTSALWYTPYNAGNPCNYINNFAGVVSALWYTPYNTTNPCWFTTCTGTVVDSDLTPYAKSCDLCAVATSWKYCDLTWQPTIPTDNCQLANGCWYTTCMGTLTADNICDSAFWSSWDWVTTKAPSMNAVYDVLWDVETLLANI